MAQGVWIRWTFIGLGLWVAGACSDSAADRVPFAGRGGAAGSGNGGGGGGGGAAGEVEEIGPANGDRCLTPPCIAPHLPVQPEVPLLADAGDGWQRLIEADWELAPGSEGYRCVRRTLSQDVFVTAFSPLLPGGTHHTVLVVASHPDAPDGVTVCSVGTNGERRLQGAGAGTPSASLPEGVAMKIGKGEQLLMNLHLFNPGDQPLRGTSGMRVNTVAAPDVKFQAEVVLAGPLGLSIPRGHVVQRGSCTFGSDVTVFSVGPHMHQLGVHAKLTAHSSIDGERVLHDAAYDFTHQLVYQVEPIKLAKGDKIDIECTYENTTDRTVTWGDSTLDEMCFAGVGLYPAMSRGAGPCTN
ncbi:MAG TPA: hypothetical protein VJV78_21410 [Polyangiales bacterium]|nr:hypothetical protein [Polyangiales bacterium]